MSKRTLALIGPWAILVHIGLTRVRAWEQIFLEQRWYFGWSFCFLATVVISGISFVLFRGRRKNWPWGAAASILGTSAVSAVLLTASLALENAAQSSSIDLGAVSLASFEAGFLAFFVVLMKAIIVGQPRPDNAAGTWREKLGQGFRAGQQQVR
jgi:hypothetical protein